MTMPVSRTDVPVKPWTALPLASLPSPCFVVDEARLLANMAVINRVRTRTDAKILLALKGFAMFSVFGLLQETLSGTCASSPHEARLGREEFGGIVSAFAAGYSEEDMRDIIPLSDHITFNSFAQYRRFAPAIEAARSAGRHIECGLRINPEHSEGAVAIYNPCSPQSRLGIRLEEFQREAAKGGLQGISGLHCHTLCEQNADALARTLDVVEKNFGPYLRDMAWYNAGGGHHITREDYDVDLLCERLIQLRDTYKVQVYIEPGEAVALNTGVFKTTVLDIVNADMPIAILDSSAPAHLPDVLEMPYRPSVTAPDGTLAGLPGEGAWTCRLAGKSCLAGDVMGEYSFSAPLAPGDVLLFMDMAHYTMVKTTTFNGLKLPSIARITPGGEPVLVKEFGYENFHCRLS
ncbi:Carboxynorspermidine/carboxyspermidine decarboxylase [uncultured delta proteobacterium]|uniref:Carboxynorspermidine/carboxyspermidine decarboxylase n=1 Tax=uncultured delta proteobacterium TaxID=34034 RepID=A0A212J9H5_9DELT|nr:Carboxynorspermidine/carboxyspermidine decarboxylase [uncultured delta proteobacterium]